MKILLVLTSAAMMGDKETGEIAPSDMNIHIVTLWRLDVIRWCTVAMVFVFDTCDYKIL